MRSWVAAGIGSALGVAVLALVGAGALRTGGVWLERPALEARRARVLADDLAIPLHVGVPGGVAAVPGEGALVRSRTSGLVVGWTTTDALPSVSAAPEPEAPVPEPPIVLLAALALVAWAWLSDARRGRASR